MQHRYVCIALLRRIGVPVRDYKAMICIHSRILIKLVVYTTEFNVSHHFACQVMECVMTSFMLY